MTPSIRVIHRTVILFALTFISSIIALSQTSWTGANNTNWNHVGNWTNGIPTAATDVIIGDANFTGTNQPNLNVVGVCKSLTIGTGAKASTLIVASSVTVSGNVTIGANGTILHNSVGILTLTGNWSNSGIYNATVNGATLTFAGAAQSFTGPTAIQTMNINAGSTLTLNSSINVNRPLTVNGTLDPGQSQVTMNNNFIVNSGAKIRVNTALYSGNYSNDPTTLSAGSTVEYTSSSVAQTVSNTLTYGTLLISGTSTKTLAGNLPALNAFAAANGNIQVTGGTLDLAGFTANRANTTVGGTLSVSNGATLKIGGTNSIPTNYATHTFGASSTVEYNGTAQAVGAETYGNLTLSSAGNKTAAGVLNIAGDFSLSNATFIGGSLTHNLSGNWTMSSGSFTNTGTTISLTGGSTHTITSTGAFNNLTTSSAGGAVTAGSDVTVNGVLALADDIIATGVNKVILPSTGSITRTSGRVNGFLQKHASTGPSSLTFEVGDASRYAPVDVAFGNVTSAGDLVVSTTGTEHPSIASSLIDATKDANRYWTVTGAGVAFSTYDINLHFTGADVDGGANTSNFEISKYNNPTWANESTGTRTATSTQALGLPSFSDFAVGELKTFTITASAGANGSISPSGSIAVTGGKNQAFIITPNTNYHVDSVIVDGTNAGPVGVYTFTNVTANHTIRAVFAIDQHTITATSGPNGSITPSGLVLVNHGSDQAFTITPNTNYHIDSVLVDGVNVGPVGAYTFTNVTANHTIRTVYAITQFTITATTGPNGSITPSGSIVVNSGSNQVFTVTPNTGYHIDSVLVDGANAGPVGAYTFTNVTANHTIRTVYAIDKFTITATTGPNGSISPNGSIVVNYGTDQAFTVTPNAGYHVDSVIVDGANVGQVGAHTFTNVTANHTIRSVFAINQFTISATAGPNGSIAPSGSVLVDSGSSQGFTVTPNTGYHVDSVIVDGANVGAVGAYTFTSVAANHSIRTVYAIDQFTIAATTGPNGSITPSGSIVVNYGSDQAFTLTPNTGYHVDSVIVDGANVGSVGAYTFSNVTASHSIRAVYAIDQFTITATTGPNGSISPGGSIVLNYGADQAFTVTANTGYHIDSVIVDGANVGPVGAYTFNNVTANHTIRTVYAIDQFTISATTGPNGSISPSGSVGVNYGATQGFTITPNTGYFVSDVQVDSGSVGAVTNYSFTNVTANHSIHATFAIIQYTITASAGANGSISPSGAVLVDHGNSQAFTVTANTGYHIDSVIVDGANVGSVGTYTFTNVTANHSIRTVYAIDQFTINATTGPNGSITPGGSVAVSFGATQAFTITPNTGYFVSDVQVDSVSVGAVTNYSFTNVTANHSIHATFAITKYTITATAGANGTISPNGAVLVDHGNSQAFTVTANTGYHIDSVIVDGSNVGPVGAYSFTNVTANHTIRTVYSIDQFTINATTGPNGSISPGGSVAVSFGATQAFTITPNTGYFVSDVQVDSVSVGAVTNYSFTNVTANHTIRATFAITKYTITATAGANGTISPSGAVLVDHGSSQAFTVTADTGYHIDSVIVDGANVGPVGAYSFTNVTANHTIRTVYAIDQFTITATTGSNGSITPSGPVLVNYGASQAFTVTANTGYHIDSVIVDGANVGAVGAYTFNNVKANHTIRTVYAIDQFTIIATTGPNGSITPSGSVGVSHGATQGFTITPDTGYFVSDVQVDSVSVGAVTSYSFTNVTANHTIHATFAIIKYTITASVGANGTISPSGAVLVNHGNSQAFTVTANTGYHIDSVIVDGANVGPVGAYSFTNVTANHTIRTVYAIDQFTITATTGPNGSLAPSGSVLVNRGASQAFTITANTGYHIDSVIVDGANVGPVGAYSFTNVTANHTIRTVYAINQFTITATTGPNGSISPSGIFGLSNGDSQAFTITPNTGYFVVDVQVDSVSVGQVTTYTFTNVTANHTIHATFAITQYTITASAGSNGSITPNGALLVNHGASQTFIVTPDTGYFVSDVHVDSVSVGQVTSYTFTNVTANHTIHATFAITKYTINASADLNGSISPNGAVLVNHGASQNFTITANTGYFVSDVHVDSVSVGQVTSYTFTNVTANHTIHASFAIMQFKVSATAGLHGTITPSGSTVANYGDSLAYTITPDNGYFISDVHVDTVSVGAVTHYTFTNITANHSIAATFTQILNPVPVLSSITPSSGYRGDTLDVTYHGHHFINGVTSLPAISGIGTVGVTIVSDSILVHRIAIGVNASLGAHGLYVMNAAPGGGNSDTLALTVANHAPSAARLTTPASGDTLIIENLGPAVAFTWRASADADVADSLKYSIHLSGPGIDSVIAGLTDTTLQWGITSMLQVGATYWWTVNATDGHVVTASPDTFRFHVNSLTAVLNGGQDIPKVYALFQNFPNPFNPTTVVRFDLPRASNVRITVYNMIGQQVAVLVDQASMGAGHHEVVMDAGSIASGVYLYRIAATAENGDTFSSVKKMVLIK